MYNWAFNACLSRLDSKHICLVLCKSLNCNVVEDAFLKQTQMIMMQINENVVILHRYYEIMA